MVTFAVALAPAESVATMVNLYSGKVSKSSTDESRTIRVSALLRNPKMFSMDLRPVGLRASPISKTGTPVARSSICYIAKYSVQLYVVQGLE